MTEKLIQDIIQWDIKSWTKALEYWDQNIDWNKINNALELGGREGGLSLWLGLKGKEVICSDLKDVKSTAEPLHIRHNVNRNITYQDIDATNIPYENHFDLIVFKSILGGIGSNNNYEIQKKVFGEIYKALKPGGKLLFAENLVASPLHQELRKRFVNWGNTWRYLSLNEITESLNAYASFSLKATGFLATFGRNERQRNFLSSIDELFINKACPDNWKYIGYGIAEK